MFIPDLCQWLVKLEVFHVWRWWHRKVTRKLVRRILAQLVSFALVFGEWAFVIPNLVHAADIVPDGQTATQITSGEHGLDITTSTIYGNNALNSFKYFDVHNGDIVNLHLPTGATNLLNLVHLRSSQIDGIVNAYQNGRIGGNVYFLNPYGMIVGAKGQLNVGQLTVITPPLSFIDQFFVNPNDSINRVLTGNTGVNDAGQIEIEGEINATQGLSLQAGSVVNTGRLVVDITQSPDFADLVNINGFEQGNEFHISNGNIEIVATGDVVNSGEISTAVYGYEAVDAGNISIDAGGNIVLGEGSAISAAGTGVNSSGGAVTLTAVGHLTVEESGVIDARGGLKDSSGGDILLTAGERIELAGEVYTGLEKKSDTQPSDPTSAPSGTIALIAPDLYISGMIDAGAHEGGVSSGDVYFTAQSDTGGAARIRLDGASVYGRDIFFKAGASLEDNSATGLVQHRVAATIDLFSKNPERYTIINAGRDISMLAEAQVALQVAEAIESDDAYDAGYAGVDVDSTARIHLDERTDISAGGDLRVEAKNTVNIVTQVNPNAQAPSSDYVGGSVAVNRVNTHTEALINSEKKIEVAALTVKATSANTVTAKATAPMQGAKEDAEQESKMAQTLNAYQDDARTSEGAIAVAAALAVNDITNVTRAEIRSEAGVAARERVDVLSLATYNSTVNADAGSVTPNADAIGAAVGINKVNSQNDAFIDTVVSAGEGITIAALMLDAKPEEQTAAQMTTTAVSGSGAGNTTVSGALAVNVQRTDSTAYINRDAETQKGGIDIIAVNMSENSAAAKPAQADGDVGVGPSVALNLAVNSARAGAPDDTLLSRMSLGMGSDVSIRAQSDHTVNTTADAGAGGDMGVAPAVALAWIETVTQAGMGTANPELWWPVLSVGGNITISANSKEKVTTVAKGESAGEDAAIGAAIALTVGDSVTESGTARGIDTDSKITLEATGAAQIHTMATAGAKGGEKADDQTPADGVDQKIAAQKELLQDKRKAVMGEGSNKLAPSAETSEGTMGVAAAIGVNLVNSVTRAYVADDAWMWAGKGLTLRSAANIDTDAKADGSAVLGANGDIGIGAAVAINQATLRNEAYLGGGSHYAGNFTIEAKTLETGSGDNTDKENKHSTTAISGGGAADVGVAGALAINLLESSTLAHVGERALLQDGAVSVTAVDRTKTSAKAAPAKEQTMNEDVGIGASVAVHVALGETRAEIGDESLLQLSRTDAGVNVSATSDYAVTTEAQGGIAGGIAVTSATAVTVYERSTLARLGFSVWDDNPVYSDIKGDVTVEAKNKESITTTANGGSQSDKAAIGAAMTVALVDSYTEAVVNHHVKSQGKVTIKAESTGKTVTTAVASTKGGKVKDDTTPEDGVDQKVKEQSTLAAKKRGEAKGKGDEETTEPKSAPAAETAEGKVSVAGAISVNVANSLTGARTADGASIVASGNLSLSAEANMDTTAEANGSAVGSKGSTAGVGAAVAINQATLTNVAYLGSGMYTADSFTVEAKTLETGSGDNADKEHTHTARAVSGAGSANVGVAGSLAINLSDSNTSARIGEGARLNNGAITVNAVEKTKDVAKAEPGKDQTTGKEVGIGAAAAVNVVLGETRAEIGDEVVIHADKPGAGISVSATGDHTVTTEAQGGAAGDVAVTPATALTVYERATLARIGITAWDVQPQPASIASDLTVQAQSKENITTTAKGSTDGATAAIGASVAVALVDSVTEAVLEQDVKAGGKVTIAAQSTGEVVTGATAGIKGGKGKDGDTPEDGVDKKVQGQNTLAAKKRGEAKSNGKGAARNNGEEDSQGLKAMPSAETGEGKVSVAGAIGVNAVNFTTQARTPDNIDIMAAGAMNVTSASNIDTETKADGKAVDGKRSNVGIGAAVAINQASVVNQAYLGTGTYEVAGLTVTAKTLESGSGDNADKESTHTADAISGAGANKVGVAGSLAVNLTENYTLAQVGQDTLINSAKGNVTIAATSASKQTAKAMPGKDDVTGNTAGVGASVAVNVALGGTEAHLLGWAHVTAKEVKLESTQTSKTQTVAEAGAAGGTAVTPVVAITVSDQKNSVDTGYRSYITADKATLLAKKNSTVTTQAEGDSTSNNVAVGAAVALAFVNDHTAARLAGDVESAGDVSLTAEQTSRSDTSATANSKGGEKKDAQTPDNGVDKKLQEQTALAEKKQEEAQKTVVGQPTAELTTPPAAKTDEGQVSVAAAISVNTLNSSAQAFTAQDAAVLAQGKMTVDTKANHVATSTANAATVNAGMDVGVGAAVAINKVDALNTAYLSSGKYIAHGVTVQAGMTPGAYNISSATATSGAGAQDVGVAGALALNLADTATIAQVQEDAKVDVSGADVLIAAESRSGHATRAVPAEDEAKGNTVGVGASVAVFTHTDSTVAEVAYGAELANLRHLDINATSHHNSETEAKAGAAGGVAIDSVVAVAKVYQTTHAVLYEGNLITPNGNVNLQARDIGYHNVSATGDVTSDNVGVGSAVALLITNSDIYAGAFREIRAEGSINVAAQAERYYNTYAVAGAKGALDTADEEQESTSSKALQENADAQQGTQDDGKVLAAAAVAMTIAADNVQAVFSGSAASSGDVKVKATNTANFSTLADGSTADLTNETGISNAVALSIVRNDTVALLAEGSTVTGAKSVEVKAETQTNTNPSYLNKLATEAISGSGAKKVGVAGALAVTYSSATTQAFIGHDAQLQDVGNVTIAADNTGKLSAKAWSGGAAKVGVGASVATIVSENTYKAYLGDNVYARVGSLTIRSGSDKIANPVPFKYKSYADLDLQSLLGSSNYYTEAIAGAAASQTGASGSFAVNILNDMQEASIGQYAMIYSDGPVRVDARYDATIRTVNGSLAAAQKVGVGAAMTNIINETVVRSTLGTYAGVYAASSIGITAAANTAISSFAASAAAGGSTGVAGVSSLIASNNRVEAMADEYSRLFVPFDVIAPDDMRQGDIFITATNTYSGLNIAGDAAGGNDVGVGGSHATNLITNTTLATAGRGVEISAFHGIDIVASSRQDLLTVAAGGAGGSEVGVAGSSTINTIDTTTHAWIGEGAWVNYSYSPLPQPVTSDQYVRIKAADTTEMTSAAGGAAFGGKAGVGTGLDVTLIDKDTQAYIDSSGDPPTYVNVYHTLELAAESSQDVTSIVGGLAGSSGTGVAGNSSVYNITNTTKSYIGEMASVDSRGNVLVSADDANELHLIAGNAAFGGSAGVGASGAIVVIDKITEAYIDNGAFVTALGKGAGILTNTGQYDVSYAPLSSGDGAIGRPNYNLANLTGDTAAAGDDSIDNPSMTMERTAALQQTEIKGLAVTATSKDHIESIAAGGAAAGSVAVSAAATVSTVMNRTRAYIDQGAWINSDNAGAGPDQTVFVAAGTDYYHLGIAGTLAGASTAGVGPGTDISVVSNTTEAFIGEWAMVNAAGNIAVEAYAHEDILSITAAAVGGGGAGVAGGASINYIDNHTHAYIADEAYTTAGGNIKIAADDATEVDVIAGSLGIGSGAGVGQALNVTVIDKETLAYVGNRAVVDARGNNGGYLHVFTGEVDADGQWSVRNAKGLLVQASSKEDVFNVVVSGGAGIWAGVAGAVTVNKINANTQAYVGEQADINAEQVIAHYEQGVHIAAVNNVKAKSITGSVGGAVVGVSGAVDIGTITNTTAAYADQDAILRAKADIGIVTLATKDLTNYALGHAGGMAGTTGGVSIWTIGGALDLSMETPAGEMGQALEFEDGGSVEGLIDRHLYDTSATQAAAAKVSPAGLAEDESGTSFGDLGFVNVVDFLLGGYLSDTLTTIAAVREVINTVLFGLATAGLVGDDAPRADNQDQEQQSAKAYIASNSEGSTMAMLGDGALASGRNVAILAREDVRYNQTVVGASTGAVTAGAAVGITTLRNHVVAFVGIDAVVDVAESLQVGSTLAQRQNVDVITGTLGFFGNLGGAVAGLTDSGSSMAKIGSGAIVASGGDIRVHADNVHQTDILALNPGVSAGAVNGTVVWGENLSDTRAEVGWQASLAAVGTLDLTANSSVDMQAEAYAPAVGAFLGLGAAWAELHDGSTTSAMVRSGSEIKQSGAFTIQARHTPYLDVYTVGAGTGAVAVGAAVANAFVHSTIAAGLDSDVRVGQEDDAVVGSLLVMALMDVKQGADTTATAQTDGAAASPAAAGVGSDAVADVAPLINASIGTGSQVKTLQDISLYALSYSGAQALSRGLNIAGMGVGLSFAAANVTPEIRAIVAEGTVINSGEDVTITARHNIDSRGRFLDQLQAQAEAWSATGSLLAGGTGADADANASAIVEAYIGGGSDAALQATGTLTVSAEAGNAAHAVADGQAYSAGIGVGAVFADAVISGATAAQVDAATVSAGNLRIEALTQEQADALTKSGAGAILAGTGSMATAEANSQTYAFTGDAVTLSVANGAQITAQSQSQANADALGVNVGLAAVGVSAAVAQVAPIVKAYLGAANHLTAASLAIQAQVLPLDDALAARSYATGSSGGLVGANATYAEATNMAQVAGYVGDYSQLAVSGTTAISAAADTKQKAEGTAYTGGFAALGANYAAASSDTNIMAYLGQGVRVYGGALDIRASGVDDNYAEATAGTGGVLAGNAAASYTGSTGQTKAYVDTATATGGITVGSFFMAANHETNFNAVTDSINAAVIGASGALATNMVERHVQAEVVGGAQIRAGNINIVASNTIVKSWLEQYQVRSGSGGLLDGAAASSQTDITNTAVVEIGDQARLEVIGDKLQPGTLQLAAANFIQAYDRVRLDAGGGIEIAKAQSEIRNNEHVSAVRIGANANLVSVGDINISATSNVDMQTRANARTYGGAGAAQGEAQSYAVVVNDVDIAGGADLLSLGHIYLRAGSDYRGINGDYNILANTDLWNKTAFPIETEPEARAYLDQTATVNVQPGAALQSVADAYLVAAKGQPTVVGYGVGTDHYREFLAEIGQVIADAVGEGEEVSLKKEFHSSTHHADTTVRIDGLVQVGIENKRYLYIDENGNIDTRIQADGTTTSEGITITLTVEDLRAQIEQRIQELQDMKGALNGFSQELFLAEKTQLETERADKVSKIAQLQVEKANLDPVHDAEQIAVINDLIGILNARIQAIDNRLTDLAILGGPNAQQLAQRYDAEIAELQFQLAQLGDRSQVTVININEPIIARSGNIYVTADSLVGTGNLQAAGDTTIKIENKSPYFLRTNQLIIPDQAGGQVYFNKVAVNTNAQINARSYHTGAGFAQIRTSDNTQSQISVVNSYIPTGGAWGPDILVDGDIRNLRGSVNITSLRGSIQVKDGVNLVADHLTINAGRNLTVGYALGFKNIAGDIEAHWREFTDWVEDQGWASYDPGPHAKPEDFIDITWAEAPTILMANNIFIAAEYLNINGVIQSGIPRYDVVIDESLESEIAAYKQQYEQAKAAGHPIDRIYTGLSINPTPDADGNIDITKVIVKYDAEDDALVLEPVHIMGGYLELYGHIMNTSAGKLQVMDGYGTINIVNNTNYTLRLDDVNTGDGIEGTIKITDTGQKAANGQPLVTVIKRVGDQVQTFSNAATGVLNLDTPVTSRPGRTTTYKPLANQYYSWTVIESTLVTEHRNWDKETWFWIFDDVEEYTSEPTQTYLLEPTKLEGAVVRQVPGRNSTYWYEGTHYYTNPTAWENQWTDWQRVESRSFLGIPYYTKERMRQERTTTITQIHNHNISASHPIAIEFLGNDTGELFVSSLGDIVIDGTISNTKGTTSLTSQGAILQGNSERGKITGDSITLWARTGIGQELQPLLINQASGVVSVSSNLNDINLQVLQGDIKAHQILAVQGNVHLTADGNIKGVDNQSLIYGEKVELVSLHGGIGAEGSFITIDTGGNVDGDLTATAQGDIYLWERSGDLYLNQVTSRSGDVHLGTSEGDLIDNNQNQIKDIRAEQGLLSLLWEEMELLDSQAAENAERTVRAYEQKVESEYFHYWQYRQRQVSGKGRLPLPPDEYHPDAVIALTKDEIDYYRNQLGWTEQQIAAYEAKMTAEFHALHKTYGVLGNEYNPKWSYKVERPQINGQTVYDPRLYDAEQYKEWDALINGHAWTAEQLTNVIGSIKEVTDTRVWIEEPNIIGHNVTLTVAGSIGHDKSFSIPAYSMPNRPPVWSWSSLTPEQQLQILAAERDDITYGFTTMTVTTRETVDVEATGKLSARSWNGHIYLGSESDINLNYAVATGAVRIKTAGNIYNATPGGINVRGGNTVLEAAQGNIGTINQPLLLDIDTAKLTARAAGNIYLATETDFYIDTIYTPGHVRLSAPGGSIYATSSITPFVRDDLNIRARSLWLDAEIHIGGADATNALQIGLDKDGTLSALAGGRININSPRHDLTTGQIEAGGDITLTSSGNIHILSGTLVTPQWVPPTLPPIDPPEIPELLHRHVQSTSGKVTLTAGGAILDGDSNAASGISGKGITLKAGGSIGTAENALELHLVGQTAQDVLIAQAEGDVAVTAVTGALQASNVASATGNVHLTAAAGPLQIGWISANNGTVTLHAADYIIAGFVLDPVIRGRHINLVAQNGHIGSLLDPLEISAGTVGTVSIAASAGTSIYLQGIDGNLAVERIAATAGNILLSSAGAITGVGNAAEPHVTLESSEGVLMLVAENGSMGDTDNPITFSTQSSAGIIVYAAEDVFLTRLGGDMLVEQVQAGGKQLVLHAPDGGIYGGTVSGAWVTLHAQGNVGGQNPLLVRATEELFGEIGGSAYIAAPEDYGFTLGDMHVGGNLTLGGKEIVLNGAIRADGDLYLIALDSILGHDAQHSISGKGIELKALNGSIGTSIQPIIVANHTKLNAEAYSHIYLEIRNKNLVSDYIKSHTGKVGIRVPNGGASIGKIPPRFGVTPAQDELWGVYATELTILLPTVGSVLSIGQANISGSMQLNADVINVTGLTHTGPDPLQVTLSGGSQSMIEQLTFSGDSNAGIAFNGLAGQQVEINVNTPQLQLQNTLIGGTAQINTQAARVLIVNTGSGSGPSDVILAVGTTPFDLTIGQSRDIQTNAGVIAIGSGFTVNGQSDNRQQLVLQLQPLFGTGASLMARRLDSVVVVSADGLVNADLDVEEEDEEENDAEEEGEEAHALTFNFATASSLRGS